MPGGVPPAAVVGGVVFGAGVPVGGCVGATLDGGRPGGLVPTVGDVAPAAGAAGAVAGSVPFPDPEVDVAP